jgi:stage II sporulation protein D
LNIKKQRTNSATRAKIYSLAAVVAILLALAPLPPRAVALSLPSDTVRVGLYYGSNALPSANLQNSVGYGYDFGYFDSDRKFVKLAEYTSGDSISMLRDVNMYYDSTNNAYKVGSTGNTVVGCFHIQFNNGRSSYADAVEAAQSQGIPNYFIKYVGGEFHVCSGNYTTAAAAETAMANLGFGGNAAVNAGTSQTISVVSTGTNRVIFEFDSSNVKLAVRPKSSGKALTWFKGYKYYGAFQYNRASGGDLTIINFVLMDDYVKGVLPYEMGNTWPLEALKAQAVCARTYAAANLDKHSSYGFDLCDTDDCQVYYGTNSANALTDQAVNETAGMYITYNGAICTTFYTASDGGATESVVNVWGSSIPYLIGVTDPYEADVASQISNYAWTVKYTPQELTTRLNARGYTCATIKSVAITSTTPTGNAKEITLTDVNGKVFTVTNGDRIRSAFGVPAIRFGVGGSTPDNGNSNSGASSVYVLGNSGTISVNGDLFVVSANGSIESVSGGLYALSGDDVVEVTYSADTSTGGGSSPSSDGKVDGNFVFQGFGRGHNVGMSQWGAYSMAKVHGKTFDEIIHFYFTGVEITYADGTRAI